MREQFSVAFLQEAVIFMDRLDKKSREKIYYNLRKAQITNHPELFKKLTSTIWEFRTLYNKTYYWLFAFRGQRDGRQVLIIITHGMIKKTGKTPATELEKAERTRQQYFVQKLS
jgi:phage-related protein